MFTSKLKHQVMEKKIFVNLPVKSLEASIAFFTNLGFSFNPKFTDENATCMVVSENIFVMLLVEKFYKGFTVKEVCNTATHSEVILSIQLSSKQEVDGFMAKVLSAGGIEPREPQVYDFMYGRSFQDCDGHLWEVFYMDESAMPQ